MGASDDPRAFEADIPMSLPRVLIVEDNSPARRALVRLFVARGWRVVAAENVDEAIASLDPPPDSVVLDLMLPDGAGEDVLERIRQEGPGMRVVVCTGTHEPGRLAAIKKLAPTAILRKPVRIEEVFQACEEPDPSE